MKHLKPQKLHNKKVIGVVELYKNNRRIRYLNFTTRRERRNHMKRMLQYSNTELNNYHFIVKLYTDELF
jgi:hypothetical protein